MMNGSASKRVEALAQIPLFSYLTAEELEEAQALFVERVYQRGDTVCKAGDEGDIFYIILNGELEVWGVSPEGEKKVLLNRLGAKDFFGELALVLGGKRSATVSVSQRATLLELNKESFNRFFLKNAKALEYFSRVICQRLASAAQGQNVRKSSIEIAVVGRPGLKGKTLVATAVADLLREFTQQQVLLVRAHPFGAGPESGAVPLNLKDLEGLPGRVRNALRPSDAAPVTLDAEVDPGGSEAEFGEMFSFLVEMLSADFPFMVFDLMAEPRALAASVGQFSDICIEVVDKPNPETAARGDSTFRTFQVVNLYNRSSAPIPINACEPFVIPRDAVLRAGDLKKARSSAAFLPLQRLARKITGKTVGVALGGGAAFGLAHLGVLKVLEDNHIPIDLFAGCSFGSLVAVGYASGYRAPQLIEMAYELTRATKLIQAVDPTLSRPGLLAGDAIKKIFGPFLGVKQTFDRLNIPCRAIATDIETGERVDIKSGLLADAFRASCSVPVVLSPVRIGDRVLVDGGVCDPVPAEIVRNMGADICIAVNVVPRMKKGVEMMLSKVIRQMNRFNPLTYIGENIEMPNMFDITMGAMQILQHELGNFKAISADVRINPDLSDFTWVDFHRSHELIEKGIEATEHALPAIKRAIASK